MLFRLKESYNIEDLKLIVEILRGEDGCPWDKVQTHKSMRKNFIEETYEVIEAIDNDNAELLREELGDVLLQVVFHAQIEAECNEFAFEDVVNDICQKLVVRHPHIFSDVTVVNVEQVLTNWNAIKAEQKGQTTVTETMLAVPKQLPSLMRTMKVQERAEKGGITIGTIEAAVESLRRVTTELTLSLEKKDTNSISEKIGEILFKTVNISRLNELDPEEILYNSCDRFIEQATLTEATVPFAAKIME